MIRISIDPQPYPHDTDERDRMYSSQLSPIVRRYFSQLSFQYYYNCDTKRLTDIEIGCFEGKTVKNHDESRHEAIVEILRRIKALFMHRNIKCTIIHVLDTEMSFMDYGIMLMQKKVEGVSDGERTAILCRESGLSIICPECGRSTELVTRAEYPNDPEMDESIQMDGDLVEPEMTRKFYDDVSKDKQLSNKEKSRGPVVVAMFKDHGKCQFSNKNVLVIWYIILKHDLMVGGMTFRLIRVFADGEKIKNVYEV